MDEALAKVYDGMYLKYPEDILEEPHFLVSEALTYEIPGAVLDIGAGLGRHSLASASRKHCRVTAVDISSAGVERLNRIACQWGLQVEARVADILEEGIENEYGLIICTFMLHHLLKGDGLRLLDEMREHTLLGGINVIAAVTTDSDYFETGDVKNIGRCYFELGELGSVYANWEILRYVELDGFLGVGENGLPMQNTIAGLIARRPATG